MKLSIILPCYNESEGIVEIFNRFQLQLNHIDFELILVDNGSNDNSQEIIAENISDFPFAKSIRVDHNIGYGHGIVKGLEAASGDYLAWSHADLQTDPSDVFKAFDLLIAEIRPDKTLVKGVRHGRLFIERFVSKSMSIIAYSILGKWVQEINAQPKVFHRSLFEQCNDPPLDFSLDMYYVFTGIKKGWKIVEFDVAFPPRTFGVSKWASSWRSKIKHILASIRYMIVLRFKNNETK